MKMIEKTVFGSEGRNNMKERFTEECCSLQRHR